MQTIYSQIQTEQNFLEGAHRGTEVERLVTESTFEEVPVGAAFRLRSVSFVKLQAGDLIMISSNSGYLVRRFLGLAKRSGNSRLVVVDGTGQREELPFVRLLGLVSEVKEKGVWANPNPRTALRRAGYALYGWFTKNQPAA